MQFQALLPLSFPAWWWGELIFLYFLFREKLRFGVDFSLLIIVREECGGIGHLMGTYYMLFIVQSPSHVQLFVTPWTAARQASLSFTISWSLLKLMSTESVMPSNHLILCCPLLPLPSGFFFFLSPWVDSLHQVAKVLELQLQHQSFQWVFRVDFLSDWLV